MSTTREFNNFCNNCHTHRSWSFMLSGTYDSAFLYRSSATCKLPLKKIEQHSHSVTHSPHPLVRSRAHFSECARASATYALPVFFFDVGDSTSASCTSRLFRSLLSSFSAGTSGYCIVSHLDQHIPAPFRTTHYFCSSSARRRFSSLSKSSCRLSNGVKTPEGREWEDTGRVDLVISSGRIRSGVAGEGRFSSS